MRRENNMLYSIDGKQITDIPRRRQEQFNAWLNNISDSDYNGIVAAINNYCDSHSPFTSSFIPKAIWGDEPCQPILNACNQNEEHAGFFFGLIVWQVMMDHEEEWIFKPADSDDDVLGTTYWRRNG